jgi:predicted CopG family antitoxin
MTQGHQGERRNIGYFQVDQVWNFVHDSCMGSTNITLSEAAYERLKKCKEPGESFSDVVLREVPEPPARNAGELLDRLEAFEGQQLLKERQMKQVEYGRKRRSKRNAT